MQVKISFVHFLFVAAKDNPLLFCSRSMSLENLRFFLKDPLGFTDRCAENGTKIQRIFIGPKAFVFIFDKKAAREILVTRAELFGKNPSMLDRIVPITGTHGLVQLEGHASKTARLQARPMFMRQNLSVMEGLIKNIAMMYVEKFSQQKNFDISVAMTDLVLSTAFRLFLGLELDEFSHHVGTQFLRLNHLCGQRMTKLIASPLWLPTRDNQEIKALAHSIREFLKLHLKKSPKAEKNLPHLFANDEHLLDQCMTFLFAGHETTASSLAFSFLLLAKYPQYQDAFAQGNKDIIQAFYKESLRLYPPAYMVVKKALADTDFFGQNIKKGDQIIIGIKQMHYSEEYFPNAHQCIPERFLNYEYNDAFIPFSIGAKSCIGEQLAYVEAHIILEMFCKNFKILPINYPIEHEQHITLHPKGTPHIQVELR